MKKRMLVLAAAAVAALGLVPQALAAPCLPTPLYRDGHFLTAQLVNPGLVTGPVVATGCDIGVYVNAGLTAVFGADISDATYFGVVSDGPLASVSVAESDVHGIGDNPTHTGAQHGVGLYATGGAFMTAWDSRIWDYQKNGTAFTGAGTVADMSGNVVTGSGPIDWIAQNGIQYSSGASWNVLEGNVVSDNIYTQETACAPDCVGSTTGVISTGFLIFGASVETTTGEIARANRAFRNQCNFCVF